MRGKMDCFGLTDVGRVREINEDQFLIADLNRSMLIHQTSLSHEDHTRLFSGSVGQLLLVADGMGGKASGRQASTIAVESLARQILNTVPLFFRLQDDNESDLTRLFDGALRGCQQSIQSSVSAHPEQRGMGTTLTMAYLHWPRLHVVHAGDSRCYLQRDGRLEQITTDQTMAQKLVDQGILAADEASASRWSHMLWNCIGGDSNDLAVEVHAVELHIGDTLLLCTDGLTARAPDSRIQTVLNQSSSAQQACDRLVELANESGGQDNITVVVARFCDGRQASQAVLEEEEPIQRDESESSSLDAAEKEAAKGTASESGNQAPD